MNKKKILGIVASAVAVLAIVTVGIISYFGRKAEEAGGNRLGVEWYDVNGKEFTISTADELYELAELSNYYDFKKQTIKLGADIVVNEGDAAEWAENAPSRKWSPIKGFGGTFEGQGHTISGLYARGYETPIALFANSMSGAKIQNFKLTNTYFESAGFGGVASIASNGGGKFKQIYSDAILAVVGPYSGYSGGICSKLNLQSTIEECWYDGVINTSGRDAGGILDDVLGCRVTISHCLFSGEINGTWDYSGARIAGLVGRVYKSGAGLILEDSLSTGKITAASAYYTASVVGASMGSTSLDASKTYGSMGSYDIAMGRSGSNGTITSLPLELREKDLIGARAYQWTELDFDKYWVAVEEDTPILKFFADGEGLSVAGLEKAFDTSWYISAASEYLIEDERDLRGLYYLSAAETFKGKTIKLGADISLNEGKATDWAKNEPDKVWYPINKFAGTLDGQKHTISGMYIKTSAEYVGLIKQTTLDATVKNLNVKNSYIYDSSEVNVFLGTISGRGGGTFDTIYCDTIITSYGPIVGGIFGQANLEGRANFTNCWFDGSIAMKGDKARYTGGIVAGVVKGNATIEHCLNTGTISQEMEGVGMFVGGITGYVINEGTIASIKDCLNAGKIKVDYDVCVGSIVGRLYKAVTTISDTYATTESYLKEDGSFRGIGTSSSNYTGGVVDFPEAVLSGYGAYQWTTLNFKDFWSVVTNPNETPILKAFASKSPSVAGVAKKVDISWYSPDKKEFTLKDSADLYGLYIASCMDTFEGKTVKLGNNIVVNEGNAAEWSTNPPANNWFSIKKFAGTFNGQGHSISGVYQKNGNSYSGLFATTVQDSTIKNLKLENSYFENTKTEWVGLGSIAGQMGGTLDTVYSNASVVAKGTQVGGLVGRVNQAGTSKYKMTNCWFDGSVTVKDDVAQIAYIGGLAGTVVQGTLDMDNCLNTGSVTYLYDALPMKDGAVWKIGTHVGGLVGGIMNGVKYKEDGTLERVSVWNVSDSVNAGIVNAGLADGSKYAQGAGSIFGYNTKGVVNIGEHVYATKESCAARMVQYNKTTATVTGNSIQMSEQVLLGIKGYQNTLLNFDKYWTVRSAKVPGLKSFAGEGISTAGAWRTDISWYDESKDMFEIRTIDQLYGFASLVNGGENFEGKTVKLGADIDVNSGWTAGSGEPANIWTPIGNTLANAFEGTFDGQKHTLSGIYLNTETTGAGLFGYTKNSTIQNFYLKNSYFESTAKQASMGSIIGYGEGVLKNIYSDAILKSTGTQVAGLIGRVQEGNTKEEGPDTLCEITNCWFDGSITVENKASMYAAGFVGFAIYGKTDIENSLFSGTITADSTYTGTATSFNYVVAGFVARDNANSSVEITDSISAGKLVITSSGQTLTAKQVASVMNVRHQLKMENVYATSDCYSTATVSTHTDAVQDGTASVLAESHILGVKGYQNTVLDFDNDWSARKDKVPAPKTLVQDSIPVSGIRMDTTWMNEADGTAMDPYLLKDAADLYGFASLVNAGNTFPGQTLRLVNDIDLNPGWAAGPTEPENVWIPIGSCTNVNSKTGEYFAGNFDGAGHTLSGLYIYTESGSAGLFGCTVDSNITDLRIENSYMESKFGTMGSVVGYGEGLIKNVYSDAMLVGDTSIGGLIGRVQDKTGTSDTSKEKTTCYIINSEYAGTMQLSKRNSSTNTSSGGLVGMAIYGKTYIQNSIARATIEATSDANRIGGIVGQDNGANGTVEITNTVADGTITGGTDVGKVLGRATSNPTVDASVYTEGSYGTLKNVGTNGTSSITNVIPSAFDYTDADGLTNATAQLNTNASANNGSSQVRFTWKAWEVEEGRLVFGEDAEPDTPAEPGIDTTPDTKWYTDNPSATIFEIDTIAELYGLAKIVNDGTDTFANKTVKLMADVAANEYDENNNATHWAAGTKAPSNTDWVPIGSATKATPAATDGYFAGTFDGDGHTIEGLYANVTSGSSGLFGFINDATIRNLYLENSYITSSDTFMGSIAGYADGTLTNIYVGSKVILKSSSSQIGGLVGRIQDKDGTNDSTYKNLSGCDITNCQFAGTITATNTSDVYVGGFIGAAIWGTTDVQNCVYSGSITCESSALRIGGIIGGDNSIRTDVTLKNSVVAGTITGGDATKTGSVGGYIRGTSADSSVYTGIAGATAGSASTMSKITDISVKDFTTNAGLNKTLYALNNAVDAYNAAASSTTTKWDTWVSVDSKPVLEAFAPETEISITADADWFSSFTGTADDPYIIVDAADLYAFATKTKNTAGNKETYERKYIVLGANVKVNNGDASTWTSTNAPENNTWTAVGNNSVKFAGNFDGKGRTIQGVYAKSADEYYGLFGITNEAATLQNLRVENSYFESTRSSSLNVFIGGVVGDNRASLSQNIHSNATVTGTNAKLQIGGLFGRLNSTVADIRTIAACSFTGKVSAGSNAAYVGGIAGVAVQNNIAVHHCINLGDVSCTKATAFVGGVVGGMMNASTRLSINYSVGAKALQVPEGATKANTLLGGKNKDKATVTVSNVYSVDGASIPGITNVIVNQLPMDLTSVLSVLNSDTAYPNLWKLDNGKLMLK